MKTVIASLVLAASCLAQTATLTLSGPVTPVPVGVKATLTLSLSNAAGKNITMLQFAHPTPAALAAGVPPAMVSPDQATSTAGAGKNLWCANTASLATCVELGFTPLQVSTNTAYSDGAVYTVDVTPAAPGTAPFPLTALFAASTTGTLVPIVSGPAYSLTAFTLSRCDTNADGQVNGIDVQAMISAVLGSGPCPVSMGGSCTLQKLAAVLVAALPPGTCSL